MNIYKVTREDRIGYDEYIGFVVAAENEESARETHPRGLRRHKWKERDGYSLLADGWIEFENRHKLKVEPIGIAPIGRYQNKTVILASFNAG